MAELPEMLYLAKDLLHQSRQLVRLVSLNDSESEKEMYLELIALIDTASESKVFAKAISSPRKPTGSTQTTLS